MSLAALVCSALISQSTWQVSESRTLMWGGEPYMPVGVRIDGSPDLIKAAAAAGIRDVIVELPSSGEGWAPALEALKAANLRYLIAISSPAPPLEAWVIEPDGYRKSNIAEKQIFNWPMPATIEALAVMIGRRDAAVRWSARLPVKAGVLSVTAEPRGIEQALIVYPKVSTSGIPDYWENWDSHRDSLLRTLKTNDLGQGFRGLINPAGETKSFPGTDSQLVPNSPLFRIELEQLLKLRYKTLGDAMKAWSIGANDITTTKRLSRLVPLWSRNRGTAGLYDPEADKIFTADPTKSVAWKDIQDAMAETMHRRTNRLITAIQAVAAVPVIQEFRGWDGPYSRSTTALAGLGASGVTDSPEALIASVSRPSGVAGGWIRPAIMLGTDLSLTQEGLAPSAAVTGTTSLGLRGWFFRAPSPQFFPAIGQAAAAVADTARISSQIPKVLPYPEVAEGTSSTQQLPDGSWWVPGFGRGERLFLGRQIDGYRFEGDRQRFVAIWSKVGTIRVRLRAQNPRAITFESTDGQNASPTLKGKNLVDVTLTRHPIIMRNLEELPAPLEAFTEMGVDMKALFDAFDDKVEDGGRATNDFSEALRLFDEQPGASLLKVAQIFLTAVPKVSPYLWVEGEQIRENTFSGPMQIDGASGRRALGLVCRLPGTKGEASFKVSGRRNGAHEIWIAGRFLPEALESMTLSVGAETFKPIPGESYPYGPGLAWRRLGSVSLDKQERQVKLSLTTPLGTEAAVDVILFSPEPFRPDGAFPPLGWLSQLPKPGVLPTRDLAVPSSRPPRASASPSSAVRPAR